MSNNIIIRRGKERLDIRQSPMWQKAEAISKERYAKMDAHERQDAHHNMSVNERNLPGLPPFWPKEYSPATINMGVESDCSMGHRKSNTMGTKFCTRCFIDLPQGESNG